MATIINNTGLTFSSSAQQAISNDAANVGVDTVITGKNATDGGNDTLFDFFNEDDTYLFSIDLDGDQIWHSR